MTLQLISELVPNSSPEARYKVNLEAVHTGISPVIGTTAGVILLYMWFIATEIALYNGLVGHMCGHSCVLTRYRVK